MHRLDANRHHIEEIARQSWSAANPHTRAAAAQWAQFASWLYDGSSAAGRRSPVGC
jgi:hypothetical protein